MFIILPVTLARFMFICVWKRIRLMNDDLIATFAVIWASFMSIWIALTGFANKFGNKNDQLCTGIFNDNNTLTMDWQEIIDRTPMDLPM